MTDVRILQKILVESADLIALAVCRRNQPKSDTMTKRELYSNYEHGWLDHHIQRGNIIGKKAGAAKNSPVLYSRLQVEALRRAEAFKAGLE